MLFITCLFTVKTFYSDRKPSQPGKALIMLRHDLKVGKTNLKSAKTSKIFYCIGQGFVNFSKKSGGAVIYCQLICIFIKG